MNLENCISTQYACKHRPLSMRKSIKILPIRFDQTGTKNNLHYEAIQPFSFHWFEILIIPIDRVCYKSVCTSANEYYFIAGRRKGSVMIRNRIVRRQFHILFTCNLEKAAAWNCHWNSSWRARNQPRSQVQLAPAQKSGEQRKIVRVPP
jgi:hypothetical protein